MITPYDLFARTVKVCPIFRDGQNVLQVYGTDSSKELPPQAALHRVVPCLWDRTLWQMLQHAQPLPWCMLVWAAQMDTLFL